MNVYADNAATTRLGDTALAAMIPCFQEVYGNPSSLHSPAVFSMMIPSSMKKGIAIRE